MGGECKYKIRSFTCCGCGLYVEKRCKVGTSYCSLGCYRKSERPKLKTGVEKNCKNCLKSIYVSKCAIKTNNFCSNNCLNQYQSRNKIEYKCKVCSNSFFWSKSRESHNPKYCSIDCRNKCADWKFSAVIMGNLIQQKSKKKTKLEIEGANILREIGIEFKEQHLVESKFTVDVFIENKKLVIQWDGDYWHGYREQGDATPLDKRQQKRANLDKSQDNYMHKLGYKVLRFWEHDVYKNRDGVIERLKRLLND